MTTKRITIPLPVGPIILLIVLIIALVGAKHRVDRALDLWTCHARIGYGQALKLDACLAEKGW